MSHFDYVKLPDGRKRKIFCMEDISAVLSEWSAYIEKNWISQGQRMFDPESKVKYMLEGLANIILRPDMSGLLTEYQKMKIAKYEIPLSSCASTMEDEVYSRRAKKDNGEEEEKLAMYMDDTARKFDEAKAARLKNNPPRQKPKVKVLTRRQKIEAARQQYSVVSFESVIVDTDNMFFFGGKYFRIPQSNAKYAGKTLQDGDVIYDMDHILCGRTESGATVFFDMDIEPVDGVVCVGEQTNFL